jgi:hypothetical protein
METKSPERMRSCHEIGGTRRRSERGRASLPMGGDAGNRVQVRDGGRDAPQLGPPGRTRPRPEAGPEKRGAGQDQGARAREQGAAPGQRDFQGGFGHRDRFGVEPICKALQFAPSTYYVRARGARAQLLRSRSSRQRVTTRDPQGPRGEPLGLRCREDLAPAWSRGHRRPALPGRRMRADGLRGATRGAKRVRTTLPEVEAKRPRDLVDRDFTATPPI